MNELEGFADDLLYIPGNHDPITLFNKDKNQLPILSSNLDGNLHMATYQLRKDPDLVIMGLGGCVQNFSQKDGEENREKVWEPFPYKDEDHKEFNEALATLWQLGQSQYPKPGTQFILMTHEGPAECSTAINRYFDYGPEYKNSGKTYFCGNNSLRELLIDNQQNIVCNIHGHAHHGSFIQNIYKPCQPLPVINPGALKLGEFGEMTLGKTITGKWKVFESSKYYLDMAND